MKRNVFVLGLLFMSGLFVGCLDNEESKGIEELRGAKAELISAQAQVQLAEAEIKKVGILLEQQKVKTEELLNQGREYDLQKAAIEVQLKRNEYLKDSLAVEFAKVEHDASKQLEAAELATKIAAEDQKVLRNQKEIAAIEQAMERDLESHEEQLIALMKKTATAQAKYEETLQMLAANKTHLNEGEAKQISAIEDSIAVNREDYWTTLNDVEDKRENLYDAIQLTDLVSQEAYLTYAVTKAQSAIDLKEEEIAQLSIFHGIELSAYEANINRLNDSVAKFEERKNAVKIEIKEVEAEKIPLKDQITEIEKEIAILKIDKTNAKTVFDNEERVFELPVANDYIFEQLENQFYEEGFSFESDKLVFTGNINNAQIKLGQLITFFKGKQITNENEEQSKLKLEDAKGDFALATEEYDKVFDAWKENVTSYKTAQTAYKWEQVIDANDVFVAAVNVYDVSQRTTADTTTLVGAINVFYPLYEKLFGEPEKLSPIKNMTVASFDHGKIMTALEATSQNQSTDTSAYKKWQTSSFKLFGVDDRLTELTIEEFNDSEDFDLFWFYDHYGSYGTRGELVLVNRDNRTQIKHYTPYGYYEDESGRYVWIEYYGDPIDPTPLWNIKYHRGTLVDQIKANIEHRSDWEKVYNEANALLETKITEPTEIFNAAQKVMQDEIDELDAIISGTPVEQEPEQEPGQEPDGTIAQQLKKLDAQITLLKAKLSNLDTHQKVYAGIIEEIEEYMQPEAEDVMDIEEIKTGIANKIKKLEKEINYGKDAVSGGSPAVQSLISQLNQAKISLDLFKEGKWDKQTALNKAENNLAKAQETLDNLVKVFDALVAQKNSLMNIFLGTAE